jgi:hypothetical protein
VLPYEYQKTKKNALLEEQQLRDISYFFKKTKKVVILAIA